jgi:hypothetical protein
MFPNLLRYLVSSGPTLLVALVGLLLCLLNWSKLGRAALPAVGGFALYVVSSLTSFAATSFLSARVMSAAPGTMGSSSSVMAYYTAVGLFTGLLHAFALCCLLVAIMTPRVPEP